MVKRRRKYIILKVTQYFHLITCDSNDYRGSVMYPGVFLWDSGVSSCNRETKTMLILSSYSQVEHGLFLGFRCLFCESHLIHNDPCSYRRRTKEDK